MTSHLKPEYLPHRRQRPLSDNQDEYHPLYVSTSGRSLDPVAKVMVAVLAISTGLATVGLGSLMWPVANTSQYAQVAGMRTETPFEEPPLSAPATNVIVCWNQVDVVEETYVWQDSCRGLPPAKTRNCVEYPFPLEEQERQAYVSWYYSDRVLDVSCQASPEDIPDQLPQVNRFR